jgi:hypothetical protein
MRTRFFLLAGSLVATSALVACGSKSPPSSSSNGASDSGAPSDGATPSEGGGSPSDGGGGAVTFDAGSGCYPPCLASLLAECAGTGPCTVPDGGGDVCYPNGVVLQTLLTGTNQATTTCTKNGTLEYTEGYVGIGGTATMSVTSDVLTYTNASGAVVATENDNFTGATPTSTVTCGGVTYVLDVASAACSGGSGTCAIGPCM